MDIEDIIALFNRLADATQSKVPVWLVMMEMTPEEITALKQFLAKCEEKAATKDLWGEGGVEMQRILRELIEEAHRRG